MADISSGDLGTIATNAVTGLTTVISAVDGLITDAEGFYDDVSIEQQLSTFTANTSQAFNAIQGYMAQFAVTSSNPPLLPDGSSITVNFVPPPTVVDVNVPPINPPDKPPALNFPPLDTPKYFDSEFDSINPPAAPPLPSFPALDTPRYFDSEFDSINPPAAPPLPSFPALDTPRYLDSEFDSIKPPDKPPLPSFPALDTPRYLDSEFDSIKPPAAPPLPSFPALDTPGYVDFSLIKWDDIPQAPSMQLPPMVSVFAPYDSMDSTSPVAFLYDEAEYSSSLLDSINSKIQKLIDNSTGDLTSDSYLGYSQAEESAMFGRMMDREARNALDQIDSIREEATKFGHPVPPGAIIMQMQNATMKAQELISSGGREITAQRGQQYAAAWAKTFEQAISVMTSNRNYFVGQCERLLQARKYLTDASIQILNAMIAKYNARLVAWKTAIDVYVSQMEALKVQASVYATQVQAASVGYQANDTRVRALSVEQDAQKMKVDIWKGGIEAESAKARTGVEIFNGLNQANETLVRALSAEQDAQKMKVEIWKGGIEAESAKARTGVEIFNGLNQANETLVRALSVEQDAQKMKVDIWKGGIEAESSRARTAVEIMNALIQANAEQVRAATAEIEAQKAKVDLYRGQVEAESSKIRSETDVFNAKVRAYDSFMQSTSQRISALGQLASSLGQIQIGGAQIDSNQTISQNADLLRKMEIALQKAGAKAGLLEVKTKTQAGGFGELMQSSLAALNFVTSKQA
jgi:uncharacterized protein YggU (UPF0235/DUF167 family)